MNKFVIFHKAKSNYAYAIDKTKIHLRLCTAVDDFKSVSVIYGDKYAWYSKSEKKMECVLKDTVYDYYQIQLNLVSKRFTYYFILKTFKKKVYVFTEKGLLTDINENKFNQYFFNFPYINYSDLHKVPKWIDKAVCYQIFPDRFNNGNPKLNPENIKKWGTKPTCDNFMGGDLPGITAKLGYLKKLGINTIYMTPFFKSNSNHKYDIIDYMEIDPNFGTKEDFLKLIDKAHSLGMKVFLDAVFNHCSTDFFAFQDVVVNGADSNFKDWFYINEFPIKLSKIFKAASDASSEDWYIDKKTGKNIISYECFGYYPGMPKFNTGNENVSNYLVNVGRYWIDEFDIDGWRLDVSNEIDHHFWRKFREEIKKTKQDILILGEIWDNGEPWLRGDQFDGVMNYGLTQSLKDYFAAGSITKDAFIYNINQLIFRNTSTANKAMLNFLDTHDTERFITAAKDNESRLILALGFILTFVGIPMIYYGTEIGMKGKGDPDCRKCMEWNEKKWNKNIFNSVKKLINIRKKEKTLQSGIFKWIEINKGLISYTRTINESSILIVMNNSDKKNKFKLPNDFKKGYDILNENNLSSIDKYGIKIIKNL